MNVVESCPLRQCMVVFFKDRMRSRSLENENVKIFFAHKAATHTSELVGNYFATRPSS